MACSLLDATIRIYIDCQTASSQDAVFNFT